MKVFFFYIVSFLLVAPALGQQVGITLSPKEGSTAEQFELVVQVMGPRLGM